MTLHDELILELIKLADWNKPTGFIINIVGSANINCLLEESSYYAEQRREDIFVKYKIIEMTPDVVVCKKGSVDETIAIELETGLDWDFAHSLRQVKKYRNSKQFADIVIIIPRTYERFARLYKMEGFRVYFWTAKRKWQCLRCKTITCNESRIPPKCTGETDENKSCKNNNRSEFELVGLKDVKFEEYA